MLARCKKLEIGLAARTAHHQKLFNFLKTSAGPPVLWMPAYVSAGVQQLLDARKGDYLTWKASLLRWLCCSASSGACPAGLCCLCTSWWQQVCCANGHSLGFCARQPC